MTNSVTPYPYVATASSYNHDNVYNDGYGAFSASYQWITNWVGTPEWLKIDLGVSNVAMIQSYSIATMYYEGVQRAPKT